MKNETCEHHFVEKDFTVPQYYYGGDWYDAKRVIIWCDKCGQVSYDKTNSYV